MKAGNTMSINDNILEFQISARGKRQKYLKILRKTIVSILF